MNLNLDLSVPSIIKKFRASSINKETPAIIAVFLITEAKKERKHIVVSGHITDNDGSFYGLEMIQDEVGQGADLKKKLILR